MLAKRIISTIILTAIVYGVIYVDWLCSLAVTAFIAVGLYEFFTMLEAKHISIYKYFGIGMGVIIPLSILSHNSTTFHFVLTRKWELFFIVCALLFLIIMQFRRRENSGTIIGISTTIFGILYVSWLFSFMIKIRYLDGGWGLFLSVLLITKLGDIGAYLVGSRLGKTPLIPRISPHKSVEGSIGGILFSVLGALISKPFLNLSNMHLVWLGILFGVLAQLGDLSESLMKRDCNVKDSGKIFPGMGGMLDVIDSLLFTAPAFYCYMSLILRQV